jgi:hypothetical protein
LVGDIHGLITVSAAGFVDEHKLFTDGWQVPVAAALGGQWIVYASGALFPDADYGPWRGLPGARATFIVGGGTFVQWTHPKDIVALMTS